MRISSGSALLGAVLGAAAAMAAVAGTNPPAKSLTAKRIAVGTDMPLFGDRDQTIHDHLNEISLERRNGYDWYRSSPEKAVARYAEWSAAHPQAG
jgi:hypothetical protein